MLGLIEYAIRVALRLGALAIWCGLAVLACVFVATLLHQGIRPSVAMLGAALSLIGAVAMAAPALRAATDLRGALAAHRTPLPAPGGPFAIAELDLTLAPVSTNPAPRGVRVWFPRQPSHQPRRMVLYAPGLGGARDQNALLMAELASHGYIAVALDDLAFDPAPPGETAAQRELREGLTDMSSRAAYERTLQRMDERVAVAAARALDVRDGFLAHSRGATAPWGEIDASRIGFVGYSFGAATAAEAALLDPRIAVIVNLDGALFGRAATRDVTLPYLLIMSDVRQFLPVPNDWRSDQEHVLIDRELERARRQAQLVNTEALEIRLSDHSALVDNYFQRRHARRWLKLDPFTAYAIVRERTTAFLTQHLSPASQVGTGASAVVFDEIFEYGGRP